MNENQLDNIGQLIDTVENHLALQGDHMPDSIRANAAKSILSDIRDKLKEIYFEAGGEDVWRNHPIEDSE